MHHFTATTILSAITTSVLIQHASSFHSHKSSVPSLPASSATTYERTAPYQSPCAHPDFQSRSVLATAVPDTVPTHEHYSSTAGAITTPSIVEAAPTLHRLDRRTADFTVYGILTSVVYHRTDSPHELSETLQSLVNVEMETAYVRFVQEAGVWQLQTVNFSLASGTCKTAKDRRYELKVPLTANTMTGSRSSTTHDGRQAVSTRKSAAAEVIASSSATSNSLTLQTTSTGTKRQRSSQQISSSEQTPNAFASTVPNAPVLPHQQSFVGCVRCARSEQICDKKRPCGLCLGLGVEAACVDAHEDPFVGCTRCKNAEQRCDNKRPCGLCLGLGIEATCDSVEAKDFPLLKSNERKVETTCNGSQQLDPPRLRQEKLDDISRWLDDVQPVAEPGQDFPPLLWDSSEDAYKTSLSAVLDELLGPTRVKSRCVTQTPRPSTRPLNRRDYLKATDEYFVGVEMDADDTVGDAIRSDASTRKTSPKTD